MRKQVANNPRYPHHVRVVRVAYPDRWAEESEPAETVIYSGEGRCYTNGGVEGGQVDNTIRYISIPVSVNDWGSIWPYSGDIVTVTIGNVTETMEVKDFEPDNNRTVLYCKRNGNLDQ